MASPSPFSSEGQSTVGGHSPLETHSNLEVGTEYTENQRHPLPEFHQQAPQYQQATFPAPDSKYAGPATSDGKEHVPNADAGGSGRICGLKKKFFFILLAVAALMAVGLAVGLGVGLTMRSGGGSSNNGGSNDGNSTDGNSKDGPSNPLRSTSKISAASFTDEYSNTNTIVVYQREDRSIYMSTFNSSKEGWTVSPVVDGSSGISLDTVRGDTGLAVDVYQLESKTNNGLQYYYRKTIRTDEVSGPEDWETGLDGDHFRSAVNGSAIAVHGRPCVECKRSVYLFFQDVHYDVLAGRLEGDDAEDEWDWVNTKGPKTEGGLSMATASIEEKGYFRLYYRAEDGELKLLGNNEDKEYAIVPTGRKLGTDDALAAFTTRTSEVGTQILSKGTGPDDHVVLTYYYEREWRSGKRVSALDDCSPKGAMAATYSQAVYCVIDSEEGPQIKGWQWNGEDDEPTTFTDYKEIGIVGI